VEEMMTRFEVRDIEIGYSFLDSSYYSQVGPDSLYVYLQLRRYVNFYGCDDDKLTKKLQKKGYLVAKVTKEKLAERLNYTIDDFDKIIKHLTKMDWIDVVKSNYGVDHYILGECERDNTNNMAEGAFYADGAIADYIDRHPINKSFKIRPNLEPDFLEIST
jgi:hypothetical protein